MTEEQVKTWIDFLKTNPPKTKGRFCNSETGACCAIGYALDLFRPLGGSWAKLGSLSTDGIYVYHYGPNEIEAITSAKLDDRLLEALELDSEIESKIEQESDTTEGWDAVIKVIERELA